MAILGLDKKYTIKSMGFWKQGTFGEEELAKWIRDDKIDRGHYDDFNGVVTHYKGWNIINPEGEHVGIYYSTLEWFVIKFLENNVVEISRPQPTPTQQIRFRRM